MTNNNRELNLIIAIAGHEVTSFDAFYIGDEYVPMEDVNDRTVNPSRQDPILTAVSGQFRSKIYITPYMGRSDQSVGAEIMANLGSSQWGMNRRLRGIAYFYVRLIHDDAVFPNGAPQLSCVVKGKKVFDPRTPTMPARWSGQPRFAFSGLSHQRIRRGSGNKRDRRRRHITRGLQAQTRGCICPRAPRTRPASASLTDMSRATTSTS